MGPSDPTPPGSRRAWSTLLACEGGSELTEYALIAGLISVAAIGLVAAFGTKVLARWTTVNSSM